jgi:hypothetical protein
MALKRFRRKARRAEGQRFSLLSFASPKERSKEKEPEIDVRPISEALIKLLCYCSEWRQEFCSSAESFFFSFYFFLTALNFLLLLFFVSRQRKDGNTL